MSLLVVLVSALGLTDGSLSECGVSGLGARTRVSGQGLDHEPMEDYRAENNLSHKHHLSPFNFPCYSGRHLTFY